VTQAVRPGSLEGGLVVAALGEAITGLGMGLSSTTILVMVQAAVPWQRRAVATGLVQFSRTIGGAVGVGLLGAIVTASVGGTSAAILDPIGRNFIPAAQLASMRSALSGGLEWVFVIVALDAILAAIVAIRMMPAVRIERRTGAGAAGAGAAARPAPSSQPGTDPA
jgi:MFS family permease